MFIKWTLRYNIWGLPISKHVKSTIVYFCRFFVNVKSWCSISQRAFHMLPTIIIARIIYVDLFRFYTTHRLTSNKGVHQFRFFLPTMRTPNSIVVCWCMYAFLWKWHPMCTLTCDGVRIGSHFHKKLHTCMSLQQKNLVYALWAEEPKLMYALSWCKPVH